MASRTLYLTLVTLFSFQLTFGECGPVALKTDELSSSFGSVIRKRSPGVADRPGCVPGASVPPNRVNTTERLRDLRQQLADSKIHAYIITSDNAHQSEMVSPHDHRREYITGFTGSAGTAVVTTEAAALWTDGRYFIQAENQLDCNWILMKQGTAGVPSITQWILEVLATNDTVAADPTLIGYTTWNSYRDQLNPSVEFQPLAKNLIDAIWTVDNGRPPANDKPAYVHHLNYSGMPWQDKVETLKVELTAQKVDAIVVTALDEVAWLFNIRGMDVPAEPVVLSYAFISVSQSRPVLFAEPDKVSTAEMVAHLNGVDVRPYGEFIAALKSLVESASTVLVPSAIAYTGGSSFAVYDSIPESKRMLKTSPVLMMKAKKNSVEAEGMMNAHLKDGVALCDFLSLLEEEIPKGVEWTELKVAKRLQEFRDEQHGSRGASFETIAGFGANGAIIHYAPSIETDAKINTSSLLLLDSGGQYLDGTTDVTRTVHFGTPTEEQRVAYTLVLMGHVDLARLVLAKTVKDTRIDILARAPLYSRGLDFLHGTGHGIGAFLSVHESPTYVGGGSVENTFQENYFFSDEPGYYKADHYGIRIESILRVVPATFDTEFPDRFFRFQPTTLAPFDRKLIVPEMLSTEQIDYINEYYSLIREKVGAEMLAQGRQKGYAWLMKETEPIAAQSNNMSPSTKPQTLWVQLLVSVLFAKFLR